MNSLLLISMYSLLSIRYSNHYWLQRVRRANSTPLLEYWINMPRHHVAKTHKTLFISTPLVQLVNRYSHILYEGHSINKLQNSTIRLVLKQEKIRNIRFVGNLILNIHIAFLDDDTIIVHCAVQSFIC